MKIQDLIEGEIYTITDKSFEGKVLIHKYERMSDPDRSYGFYVSTYETIGCFRQSIPWLRGRIIKKSIPEEKHWLNVCIEANKYIPYEEAMKTYVEQSNLILLL